MATDRSRCKHFDHKLLKKLMNENSYTAKTVYPHIDIGGRTISRSTLENWLSGRGNPVRGGVKSLAKFLGVHPSRLSKDFIIGGFFKTDTVKDGVLQGNGNSLAAVQEGIGKARAAAMKVLFDDTTDTDEGASLGEAIAFLNKARDIVAKRS